MAWTHQKPSAGDMRNDISKHVNVKWGIQVGSNRQTRTRSTHRYTSGWRTSSWGIQQSLNCCWNPLENSVHAARLAVFMQANQCLFCSNYCRSFSLFKRAKLQQRPAVEQDTQGGRLGHWDMDRLMLARLANSRLPSLFCNWSLTIEYVLPASTCYLFILLTFGIFMPLFGARHFFPHLLITSFAEQISICAPNHRWSSLVEIISWNFLSRRWCRCCLMYRSLEVQSM